MNFRMLYYACFGLVLLLNSCSGHGQNSNFGLIIDNGINRGINCTLSGEDLSLRYIPLSITNDTTVSVYLKLEFASDYHYPDPETGERFRLVALPEEWALEGLGVSDAMMTELPALVQHPGMEVQIPPGEKILFAVGTLYPRPTSNSGVLPKTLFISNPSGSFSECIRDEAEVTNRSDRHPLDLSIVYGDACRIIRCGFFRYEADR